MINPIAFSTAVSAGAGTLPLLTKVPNKAASGNLTKSAAVPEFPDRNKSRVLILGCGNSTFGADMLADGWTGGIVNVDFSPTVISQMQQLHADRVGKLDFICADVTEPLAFLTSASFDLIVCKGTLDAVLCSAGNRASALNMVRECTRLLAPGHGIFFLVTAGNPDSRLEFLEYQNELTYFWRGVSVHPLKDCTLVTNKTSERGKQ